MKKTYKDEVSKILQNRVYQDVKFKKYLTQCILAYNQLEVDESIDYSDTKNNIEFDSIDLTSNNHSTKNNNINFKEGDDILIYDNLSEILELYISDRLLISTITTNLTNCIYKSGKIYFSDEHKDYFVKINQFNIPCSACTKYTDTPWK
jgi:hypothetical protein